MNKSSRSKRTALPEVPVFTFCLHFAHLFFLCRRRIEVSLLGSSSPWTAFLIWNSPLKHGEQSDTPTVLLAIFWGRTQMRAPMGATSMGLVSPSGCHIKLLTIFATCRSCSMNRIIRRIAIYSNSWKRLFTKKILAKSDLAMKGKLITDMGQIHLIRAYREYLVHHVCPSHLNRLVYGIMVDLVSIYVGRYFACSFSIRFN